MLSIRIRWVSRVSLLCAAVGAMYGSDCLADAPVEGDQALLKTLADVQATNLALYPKGELTAEVDEKFSKLAAKATVIWDGNRTYWKYRLKQVGHVPVKGKPGEMEEVDSVQEGEMIEIPGELMLYFPSFLQARRYVQHESGEGYARELKLRPEQTWYKYEGDIDLKELISPTSTRMQGCNFVVSSKPPDQAVVECRNKSGCCLRILASLAAAGNIIGYEILEPTKDDLYSKGEYSWAQDSAGRWYLRELHSQESSTPRPENICREVQIKVTHFNAEPVIRNDRFSFSSFDFAEGTVVEDGLILGNRAGSKNLWTYRVGANGQAKKSPNESELNKLADKQRSKKFAAPEKKPT